MKDKEEKTKKLSKKDIVTIIFILAIIASISYSKLGGSHLNVNDTITFDEDVTYRIPCVTENLDTFVEGYNPNEIVTEYYSSEEYEDYSDMDVDYVADDEIAEGITENNVTEEVVVEENTEVVPTESYAKEPIGFYDELNKTIEDTAIISNDNIDIVLQGLIMGYISDCEFVTNQFRDNYINGFLPNVKSVDIVSKDLTSGVAVVKVNNKKEYNVTYTLLDDVLDSLTLVEVTQ